MEEWVLHYIQEYKKNEIKKTTLDTYMVFWRKHIQNSTIGKVKLRKITSDILQNYYNSKLQEGYNVKTVKHIRVIINSALDQAVKLKKVSDNAKRFTTLPKKKAYEAKILSVQEIQKIMKETIHEELFPIIALTICTGLRKGEVMALKWRDIDFEGRELFVNGSLCRVESGRDPSGKIIHDYQIMEPKTQKSKRVIPLLDKSVEILLLQKARQEKIKQKYAEIYHDEDFVFARYDGRYLEQRQFMKKRFLIFLEIGIGNI